MKKLTKISEVTIIFTILFFSCTKEASRIEQSDKNTQSMNKTGEITEKASFISPATVYHSCGITVNVFTPHEYVPELYSFALNQNGQNKLIRITGSRIYFTDPDKFNFEYAGYIDKSNTVKVWRIKRTDGKYLTATNHALAYLDKLTGVREAEQIFLLSSLGNNLFKVLLPKLPACQLLATGQVIDSWDGYSYIESYEYNSQTQNNSGITMLAITLPRTTT